MATAARETYHAGLSREHVVAAAVELLQQHGVGGFSVRRLATHLGVDPMAIYKHVRNKEDLLGGAMAFAFRDARPAGSGAWHEQIAATLREHRRVVRAQPWLLDLMFNHRVRSSEPWGGVEDALVLMTAHLGEEGAARWLRWLVSFTNGFLLSEPGLGSTLEGIDSLAETRPRVTEAARRMATHGDDDFEAGLAVLLAAMRQEAGSS